MRQDQTGCRRIALEGGLGCLVVILSLAALILCGLRAESETPTHPAQPGHAGHAGHAGQTQASPADRGELETLLEDALDESGVGR